MKIPIENKDSDDDFEKKLWKSANKMANSLKIIFL